MPSYPVPPDEAARLSDLKALEILDTPPEERFDRITRIAQRALDVPIALVSLIDDDRQWFKSRAGLDAEETPREQAFCAHTILQEEVMQVPDASNDERFEDNPLVTGDPNIRFYAGAPIESPSGHKLGTLCIIDRQPRELDPEDLSTLEDLAGMVEEEIASFQLATTDALTGLSNRRGFVLLSTQILRFGERFAKPASLVFIDLDGMKPINDQFGHDIGDRALIDTARILSRSLRESDIVARLAGDEFCVLFSGTAASDAEAALGRLQTAVELHNRSRDDGPELHLSVGLADWDPTSGESLDDLMKRADRAMYRHKRSKPPRGRD